MLPNKKLSFEAVDNDFPVAGHQAPKRWPKKASWGLRPESNRKSWPGLAAKAWT